MAHPKSNAGYRIGIINPLSLVGTEIQTLLRERAFPYAKLALLDSAGKAAGALTEVDDEPAVIAPIEQEGLDDLDLVFFCGDAEANRKWIARHAEDDFIAVVLSQPTTAPEAAALPPLSSTSGKVVIAGINLNDVQPGDDVLVSPHPVAIPIALVLQQISTLSPVELCTASVVQPASEFEQEGVEELAAQTINVLNIAPVTQKVFERQLAFNLYPAAEHREEFIVSQVRSVTDARMQLALFLTQGTIFHSHTFSLFLKTKDELDTARAIDALKANPAIAFAEGDQQFGTIDAAGKDEVLIAEVRSDPTIRNGLWVWAVCDNLRRGSALNAVLAAEHVLFGTGVH
jgi:aspartate-semialdehyde dehydrogenase